MQDNWNDFIKECENASKWLASATEKTENVISAFERGEISELDLERHFDAVTDKLTNAELWALETCERKIKMSEELLPGIIPHWCFYGFFDKKPNVLGYCNINAEDFRKIFLSKDIMLAGNARLVMNVLAHECLHAILPHDVGHGEKFLLCAKILNGLLKLNIKVRADNVKELNHFKYVVFCPHCHKAIKYFQRKGKMVKFPGDYYHTACHTTLQSKPYVKKYFEFKKG